MPKKKTQRRKAKQPTSGSHWIGFDLGGTKMLAAVLDENYKVIASAKRSTQGAEGAAKGINRIRATIMDALTEAGLTAEQVRGIGIGCPGLVDPSRGVLLDATNLGWKNLPLKKRLGDEFHCPVAVLNDVDAGTYGEYALGAGRGARSLLGVFPGTGLGAGFIYAGQLIQGRTISCMELGSVKVPGLSFNADANGMVELEEITSRLGVATNVAMGAHRGRAPELLERSGASFKELKSKALAASFKAGDPATRVVMENSVRYLGLGVAAVVNLLAPDRIVLGGGLVEELPQFYLDGVKREVARFAVPALVKGVRYVRAKLGDHAVTIGSVAYLRGVVG